MATYWPQIPVFSSTSFSFCWLLNRGSWEPSPLWELVLTTASYLQLNQLVCGTRLYNCLTPTCFLWASHLHPIQPIHSQGYTLISSTRCTCYFHRCISYLTAWLRVNMQQLHYKHLICIYKAECTQQFEKYFYIFRGKINMHSGRKKNLNSLTNKNFWN